MYCTMLSIGQGVDIGGIAFIKVLEKSGRSVKLGITTALSPINKIADGLVPKHYTHGITGERREYSPKIIDFKAARAGI